MTDATTSAALPWLYPLQLGDTLATNDWIEWHLHDFLRSRFVAHMIYQGRRDAIGTAVILWSESYKQDPAGTLPDDDIELARLAGYGVDVAAWREIRPFAMWGWLPILIENDGADYLTGRLGHQVIADVARKSVKRRDGRKLGQEAARISVMRSRIKAKLAKMPGCRRFADNPDVLAALVQFLDQSNLYVTEENVRGALESAAGIRVPSVVGGTSASH